MAGLPISTFVDISAAISAGGVLRTEFGLGLLVTVDDALAAGGSGKVRLFRDLAAVQAVFGDSGDVVDDAAVWFSADPPPKSLYIGRWATADVATVLRGATPSPVADIAVANAAFNIGDIAVEADLSDDTTYGQIASAIQGVLQAGEVDSLTETTTGAGYTSTKDSSAVATFSGGNPVRAATASLTINNDESVTVTITDPGAGYQSAPTLTVTAPQTSGTQPAYTVNMRPIAPVLAGATFAYEAASGAFLLTLAGPAEIAPRFSPPDTGTDISGFLGFASGATYLQGSDSETLTAAVTAMVQNAPSSAPVAILLGSDAPLEVDGTDSRDALAAYAQAGDFVFGLLDTADAVLTSGETGSHAARVFSAQQSHVEPVYSKSGERPDIGLLALLSAQNLAQPASIITPHLKALPGVEATDITETQRAELERKRTNVYTRVGGLPSLVGGYSGKAGSWADAVWWLLWLKSRLESGIFNAQRASRRFNTAILTDTIHEEMAVAVRSGGANPGGVVNASIRQDIIATTGNQDFDGTLPAGYLAWVEQPANRTAADRESRIGRFKVWVAPADAIHEVVGDIVLSG